MARTFVTASSQHLSADVVPVSAVPFTMAAWHRPTDGAGNGAILSICDNATLYGYFQITYQESTDAFYVAARQAVGTHGLLTWATCGATAGAWNHMCGVFSATNSRVAYVNGTVGGTDNAVTAVPGSLDRMSIGRLARSTPDGYITGDLAEVGLWDVALTADEVASLADGWAPILVRPASLVAYWRLIGYSSPEIDRVGGNNLTVTGATVSAHPRVVYARRHRMYVPAAAVSAITASASEQTGTDTLQSTNW